MNKRGGARKGAGRKAHHKVYKQIYTDEKKLNDLHQWYGVRGVSRKINEFLKSLHSKGKPDNFKYNEQFLKDTE